MLAEHCCFSTRSRYTPCSYLYIIRTLYTPPMRYTTYPVYARPDHNVCPGLLLLKAALRHCVPFGWLGRFIPTRVLCTYYSPKHIVACAAAAVRKRPATGGAFYLRTLAFTRRDLSARPVVFCFVCPTVHEHAILFRKSGHTNPTLDKIIGLKLRKYNITM